MNKPEPPQAGPEQGQAEPNATELRVYQLKKRWRPHWPDTFEQATADPLISRIIKLDAAHGITIGAYRSAPVVKITKGPQGRRFIDNKSRAAGEREDDDED